MGCKPDTYKFTVGYIEVVNGNRSVMNDIKIWYPKVKDGGILAGYDYFYRNLRRNLVEVSLAVKDFFTINMIFIVLQRICLLGISSKIDYYEN